MVKIKKKTQLILGVPLSIFILVSTLIVLLLILAVSLFALSNQLPTTINQQSLLPKIASSSANQPEKSTPKEVSTYTPIIRGYQLTVPILMYHYVGNNPNPQDTQRDSLSISPEKFTEQMKYLSDQGFVTISLDTLYAGLKKQVTLPNKAIILTFDDGYIDFFANAFPILQQYHLHATVFIPTGLIDQGFYLSWSQIKQLHSSGLITVGAHSVHHSYLPSLSQDTITGELKDSKKALEDNLGVPINFLAYPYGATNETIIQLTQEAGYIGAVGTWPSKLQSEGTIYNMPRLRVSGSMDLNTFIKLLL